MTGSAFHDCDECAFPMETGAEWCPNCGLYLRAVQPGFFDRLLGKSPQATRKRHPESLLALEASLVEEIERVSANLEQLARTRGPLEQRVKVAREAGRAAASLEQALTAVQGAQREARLLLTRHRGLLDGIALERRHARMRAAMARDTGMPQEATAEAVEEAHLPHPVRLLRAVGERLVGLSKDGHHLVVWSPGEEPTSHRLPSPGSCLAATDDGDTVVVGAKNAVHLFQLGNRRMGLSVHLPRATVSAVDIEGRAILVGTFQGDLYRLKQTTDPSQLAPRVEEKLDQAHPLGVEGIELIDDGRRAITSGSGKLRTWWLTGRAMTPFQDTPVADCGPVVVDPGERRVAVRRLDKVAAWDVGLSKLQGEVKLGRVVDELTWAADGVRLLTWDGGKLLLASPASRKRYQLLEVAGTIEAVATFQGLLAVANGNPVLDRHALTLLDPRRSGLIGWTLAALDDLRGVVDDCRAFIPRGVVAQAKVDQTLLEQAKAFVRDAGLSAIYAVTRRAEACETLPEAPRIPALRALFDELEDIVAAMEEAVELSPALAPAVRRLHRLPTAVLLGQVDAMLEEVAMLFRTVPREQAAAEAAMARMEAIQDWLRKVEGLSNRLEGPFWGTPDRARMVDAVQRLKADFPELLDHMVARVATAALGRFDAMGDAHALDKLKDQRERVQQVGGLGGGVASADALLEEKVDGSVGGQGHAARERAARLDRLEAAKRELSAETRAWLEVQEAGG